MRSQSLLKSVAWICSFAVIVTALVAAKRSTPARPDFGEAVRQQLGTVLAPLPGAGMAGCIQQTIQCNQTRTGNLDTNDCETEEGDTFFDLWVFNGLANQQVTIDMTSGQVDPFLLEVNPLLQVVAEDDDGGPNLNARIQTTLDQTGQWAISASGFPGLSETGDYSLSIACQTAPPQPCVKDDQTLCLSEGRFRVEVDWSTSQGTTGQGQAVELTADTGYFWFFNEENVELIVKVLDSCGLPPSIGGDRFWVFAGGLTNVEAEIRVTDTETGESKTYDNPQNTPFQPIQDTNAFATCP